MRLDHFNKEIGGYQPPSLCTGIIRGYTPRKNAVANGLVI